MEAKKLVVFNFSERGTAEYSFAMLKSLLPSIDHVYCSEHFAKRLKHFQFTTLKTSTNKVIFLFLTCFYLPIFFLTLAVKYRSNKRVVFYFPGHHPWYLFIIKIGHFLGIQSIVTIHDGVLHDGEENRTIQKVLYSIYSIADYHIYLTQHILELMKEREFNKPYVIIPHPSGLIEDLEHHLKFELPLKFLFLGRVQKYKGVERLISIFENLNTDINVALTIAGEWQGNNSVINTEKRISILNKWLDESEIKNLLKTHHYLILPYSEASQSGIFTIGKDSGIPMIVSKVGGLIEQIEGYPVIGLEQISTQLNKIILDLVESPETYYNLKEQILNYKQPAEMSAIGAIQILIR